MPVYANIVPPVSISQGDMAVVINNENPQPALPYKSAQVAFAAAPGAFSFQLQTADTDVDAAKGMKKGKERA